MTPLPTGDGASAQPTNPRPVDIDPPRVDPPRVDPPRVDPPRVGDRAAATVGSPRPALGSASAPVERQLAPPASPPADLLEQVTTWIEQNQTTAMIGAFGLGAFLGIWIRR
jgi:hypothetical protein